VADTADRDANHALRARFDEVHGQYQRLRSGLDEIQRRLTDMRVGAESDDGLVGATVDARGQLTDLRLDRRAYRCLDSVELSRTIVDTVQAATARAGHEVEALMSAYLPPDSGTMRYVRDNDLGSLLRHPDEIMREAGDD
jgi:DNA-binding protein YbaB